MAAPFPPPNPFLSFLELHNDSFMSDHPLGPYLAQGIYTLSPSAPQIGGQCLIHFIFNSIVCINQSEFTNFPQMVNKVASTILVLQTLLTPCTQGFRPYQALQITLHKEVELIVIPITQYFLLFNVPLADYELLEAKVLLF